MSTDSLPFLSEEDYALLRRDKCRELTEDQFLAFRHAIERFRLDPLGNQIYFQLRLDKRSQKKTMSIQTGIDGYRLIADRTERYAGNDDPSFDSEENPRKATVTVYKIVAGTRCPFTATARWDQYYPGDVQGMMWKKMPHLMLGKCAEALALRKAFPAELSGLYTTEEMQQADRDAKESPLVPSAAPHTITGATLDEVAHPKATPPKSNDNGGGQADIPEAWAKWLVTQEDLLKRASHAEDTAKTLEWLAKYSADNAARKMPPAVRAGFDLLIKSTRDALDIGDPEAAKMVQQLQLLETLLKMATAPEAVDKISEQWEGFPDLDDATKAAGFETINMRRVALEGTA